MITQTPQPQPDGPMLLSAVYELYSRRKLRSGSASNRSQYRIQLKHFDKFLGHPATIADLNDDAIAEFMGSRIEEGRSPYTANKARNHLLALWRFAARKRLVENWPDVDKLKEPERIPEAWSVEQLARLFAAAKAQPGKYCGVAAGLWWHALLLVLWDTGERIGAIRQIEWTHADLASGWLIVPAEHRKFGTRGKTFRLHADTIAALRLIARPARQLVFAWDRNPTYIYHDYDRVLRTAGLPTDRRSKFHRIRRSTASHFEAAGGNATDLLGHSARRVTEHYLDPRIVVKQQAADVLFRPAAAHHDCDALPLGPLFDEYAETRTGADGAKWVRDEIGAARRVLKAGFDTVGDFTSERVLAAIGAMPLSVGKQDDYRIIVRRFAQWLVDAKGFAGAAAQAALQLSRRSNDALPPRREKGGAR